MPKVPLRPVLPRATREQRHGYEEATRTAQRVQRRTVAGGIDRPERIRRVYASGHVSPSDYILVVYAGAALALRLPPASIVRNRRFRIKDQRGNAATFNITLTPAGAETIDGAATKVISTNYGEVAVRSTGSAWVTET